MGSSVYIGSGLYDAMISLTLNVFYDLPVTCSCDGRRSRYACRLRRHDFQFEVRIAASASIETIK